MKSLNLALIFIVIHAMAVFGGVGAFTVEDVNEIAPSPAMQNTGVAVGAPAAVVLVAAMVSVALWFI
ncbi:hypothetical protein QJS04_geneDACA003151 [Acorus gramineus]|uniref:Uncharacterized protein n=1 Tax=Acorus gramineus TaxID=55184 RepID=A0AAV9BZ65_ACOGR|nr:hypothetical protein QJS04_geneDACA003151 [Acorus gramineus]